MPKSPFVQIEEKILAFWQEKKIFERSVEKRPESKRYVFYDGPPFATGTPHYGHLLASIIKDLIPRYQTMRGRRVERRWGWDCHGLPLETLAEKKLKISGKKQIEKRGVATFNQTAREIALTYAKDWKDTIARIGRWVEFDNSYKTMDSTYMESVWWALKQLWDKKLIYEGRKVLLYCPRCETPVSNAETAMDNSYREVVEESLTVKFKVKNPQEHDLPASTYFLAWTTTPWTLPANVALAVAPGIEYVLAKQADEHYLVAKSCLKDVLKKSPKIIKTLRGDELTGLEYEPLYDLEAIRKTGQKSWYVAGADFVSTEEGTGIVHTAVLYGEDDFALGQRINLPQVPLLDSAGRYNEAAPAFLRGKYIREAEAEIKNDLAKRQLIFDKILHPHAYPFCWRCGEPLIYNAVPSWFIEIQSSKKRLIALNEKINWYPASLKRGRFLNILKDAPDWNISRNRYWATPLPFWRCEKKGCGKVVAIGSVAELKEKAVNFSQVYPSSEVGKIDLHRPQIDQIVLKCPHCSGKMQRISEVIDCWVESASMPFAQFHYPFENKTVFESRFPAQFIGEYVAQTRTWFYYLHVLATLLFNNISFENVSVTGTILAEDGTKMAKSKGNFPDPLEVIERYGADALRFYLMASVVMQAENISFSEIELREVYSKVINPLYNAANFYDLYASGLKENGSSKGSTNILDRWIISRLQELIAAAGESLDHYNTVRAGREIKRFVEDFSTWWLRRSRERFRQDGTDARTAFATLEYVLRNLAQVLAPYTPFLAEHLWSKVRKMRDPESVHLSFYPSSDRELLDKELKQDMVLAREIVELAHSLRSGGQLKVRQPLRFVWWNEKFAQDRGGLTKLILEELNVEEFAKNAKDFTKPLQGEAGNLKVIIESEIDERLRELGDLRELIRSIQQQRKKIGLKQGEKTSASFTAENEAAKKFVVKFTPEICRLASLKELSIDKDLKSHYTIVTSAGQVSIYIRETT